jgi:t-SNARE complex subunit (syntaxin)
LENPAANVRLQLRAIFPEAEENEIETAISTTSNVDQAVDSLLSQAESDIPPCNVSITKF